MYRIAVFFLVSISLLVDSNGSSALHSWQRYKENVSQIRKADCDLFKGSWVFDDSIPIYNSTVCPFIGEGFDCLKNGRPDHEYLKYRWKPDGCNIPSFNGRDFLERQRGRKIMFVGDSLSNNMWQSFTCMIHSSFPDAKYSLTNSDNDLSTFSFPEYGVTIALLTNRFLVDLVDRREGKVLKLDRISTGDRWKGMDFLIFNTYHWWFHTGRLQLWDFFEVGNQLYKDMDRLKALKIGLTTWAKWIDSNLDPRNTTVFFQAISPAHVNAQEWNGTGSMGCQGQTQPVLGPKYPSPEIPGKAITEGVFGEMMNPPHLLDITQLSQLRKDGHPSIYAGRGSGFRDCSHWCLAGVPDTWNQLFYASLLRMEGVDPPALAPKLPQPSVPPPPVVPSPPAVPAPFGARSPSGAPSPSPGPSPVRPGGSGQPSPVEGPGQTAPASPPRQSFGQSPSARPGPGPASDNPTHSHKSASWMLRPVSLGFELVMVLLVSTLLLVRR